METTGWGRLTPRQRQIMTMVIRGQPSKSVAAALNIHLNTVKNTLTVVYRKLGLTNHPAGPRVALAHYVHQYWPSMVAGDYRVGDHDPVLYG